HAAQQLGRSWARKPALLLVWAAGHARTLTQETNMPMMKAHIQEGFTAAQKTAALSAYTRAIQTGVTTPLSTVRVMLEELPTGHSCAAGEIDAELTIIQVFMMEGRSEEQKSRLIAELTDA